MRIIELLQKKPKPKTKTSIYTMNGKVTLGN